MVYLKSGRNLIGILIVIQIFISNVTSDDEDASNTTKVFDLWVRFEKGYASIAVGLGDKIPIRCRVRSNGTELTDQDDLRKVRMTFYKDGVRLPDYWNNKRAAERDKVKSHSNNAFDYLEAQESHRGLYRCEGSLKGEKESVEFFVRVRDEKPQWPAIIIGGEIILLALIYFIYERQSKKREREDVQAEEESDGEEGPVNVKK